MSEKEDRKWAAPVNLGKPLNDHQDQYSFIVTNDGAIAYYSREESKNRSRLYKIKLPQNAVTHYKGNVVKGKVVDVKTNRPLKARIELFNLRQNESISVVESDSITGQYLMVLPGGADYALYVTNPSYLFQSLHFNYLQTDEVQPVIKDVGLIPIEKNASVILNNLFFDIDKYELKQSSITELNEVIKFLQLNPTLKIEISGHTDNSGTESHNQQLSLKRASAVAEYLKNQGIEADRITQKGYGSQRPLRPNNTDENRQYNRRIEFRIL